MALTLVGCGGGGGGAGSGVEVPSATTPLRLDAGNARAAATSSMTVSEAMLMLGHLAAEEVRTAARTGLLQFESRCFVEGSLRHTTLIDNDGNGRPSTGDVVVVRYENCDVAHLLGAATGSMAIRLRSAPDVENGSFAGTIDFGANALITSGQAYPRYELRGSMDFTRLMGEVQDSLNVSSTNADNFSRVTITLAVAGPQRHTDTLSRFNLTRTLQRDTARAVLSGSLHLASELLVGSLDLTITQPLRAYFGTAPDAGRIELAGAANARLTLSPNLAAGSTTALAALDGNGDGQAEATVQIGWQDLSVGFVSSYINLPGSGLVQPVDDLSLLQIWKPGDWGPDADVSPPLRLQFNRPLRSDTVIHARLLDGGDTLGQQYGVPNSALSEDPVFVDTDVRVMGAVVLVQPHVPLRYGHLYAMQLSATPDFANPQVVVVRDAAGTGSYSLFGQQATFRTVDYFWAAITGAGNRSVVLPNRPATVAASAPRATSTPLRYRWVQLDGPVVTLGSPDAASTTVQLAAGMAPGIGKATLALTITDAVGRSATTPVEVQVANPAGLQTLLSFVSATGDWVGAGQSHLYTLQTGNFRTDTSLGYINMAYADDAPGTRWTLSMAAAGGGVPPVGPYVPAVQLIGLGADMPSLMFSGSGRACSTQSAGYQVLEIAVDVNGVVQRLAVDFDQVCTGNAPASLRGSLRIHSDIPIRP